jgi:hypothetical protein
VAVALAIDALAALPDGGDRARGAHVLSRVAVDQHQVGAQTGGDAPAVAQAERSSRQRRGRAQRLRR